MMLRKTLIAAALTVLAAPAAAQGAGQEAEDFTASLNRMPAQAAPPAPEPEPEPEPAAEPESDPTPAPEDDFTARLNRAPAAETPLPPPEPEPQAAPVEASSEPPILEGLSEQLRRMRPGPEDEAEPSPEPEPEPEPEPVEPEPVEPGPAPDEPDAAAEADAAEPDAQAGVEPEAEPEAAARPAPEAAPEAAPESPPPPALEILSSQAGLAFRVDVPPAFDLVERPSGPSFDVYQVSRGDVPFVGIYVGCCSPFPIYDGRRVEAAGRLSILVQEDGANRAVEHLFVRESDGRQIHVWLHSVTGEDRAIAERIAQTVDPR